MLKSLGVAGAAIAVAALAVSSTAPATGGGGHNGQSHDTIRVISTTTEEALIDAGEPDFSLGDSFVFSSDLTKRGKVVGHAGVVCTITSVEREESQCVGTAVFRKGQITIQGLLADDPDEFELPITGGSGAFEGVGGTLEVLQISDTKELLTFNLTH